MDAVPALHAAARFAPLPAPAHHGALEEARRGESWETEEDRLPTGIAYPIVLLLSVGAWALIATVGLWLYRVLG
jgi:hypothetical protein